MARVFIVQYSLYIISKGSESNPARIDIPKVINDCTRLADELIF